MENIGVIQWCLEHLNYWTIFILMTIESSFIPFPSEVVIPPAAWLAAQGKLNPFGVIFASLLGSVAGALINYSLALYLGRPIVYRFVRSKVGKMFLLNEKKVLKAEQYFDKKGGVSTFIGRLIPGIRQLISIPAGLARMHLAPFVLYTSLGAGLWVCVLFVLGWWAASIPGIETSEELVKKVSTYSHEIGFAILGVVLLALTIKILMYYRKKRKTKGNIPK